MSAEVEAMQQLVENRHEFLAFLERRVGSRSVAEDILQDAFARSLNKAEQLENEESALAWFYRILRNAVTDHQRRSGAAQRKLEQFSRELGEAGETGEAGVEAAVCQCVKGLAATLKPEYAAALQAVEVEGVAVKDFAEAAGISKGNAAVRVFRAREALKQQVKRCCGSCADNQCRDCTCHAPPG
ncbi:MAG TPA: sigma-70 family RNA polymerase sigma factor [Polyangiaceae bacterium]|nr:sigma-70 family RNA polymerase sigma factor [Polyangiaceae bacterium]